MPPGHRKRGQKNWGWPVLVVPSPFPLFHLLVLLFISPSISRKHPRPLLLSLYYHQIHHILLLISLKSSKSITFITTSCHFHPQNSKISSSSSLFLTHKSLTSTSTTTKTPILSVFQPLSNWKQPSHSLSITNSDFYHSHYSIYLSSNLTSIKGLKLKEIESLHWMRQTLQIGV